MLMDTSTQKAAAAALGKLESPAFDALLIAQKDANPEVRRYADVGLQHFGAAAVEPLISSLADPNDSVRLSAAEALIKIKDPRAAKPLRATLYDTNPALRRLVSDSLLQFGSDYVDVSLRQVGSSNLVMTSGRQEFTLGGENLTWCSGARHTIEGTFVMLGYTFTSDVGDPLVFRLWKEKGYVYERGHGTIVTPTHETVALPLK
jgi:hypothetical protein